MTDPIGTPHDTYETVEFTSEAESESDTESGRGVDESLTSKSLASRFEKKIQQGKENSPTVGKCFLFLRFGFASYLMGFACVEEAAHGHARSQVSNKAAFPVGPYRRMMVDSDGTPKALSSINQARSKFEATVSKPRPRKSSLKTRGDISPTSSRSSLASSGEVGSIRKYSRTVKWAM